MATAVQRAVGGCLCLAGRSPSRLRRPTRARLVTSSGWPPPERSMTGPRPPKRDRPVRPQPAPGAGWAGANCRRPAHPAGGSTTACGDGGGRLRPTARLHAECPTTRSLQRCPVEAGLRRPLVECFGNALSGSTISSTRPMVLKPASCGPVAPLVSPEPRLSEFRLRASWEAPAA